MLLASGNREVFALLLFGLAIGLVSRGDETSSAGATLPKPVSAPMN